MSGTTSKVSATEGSGKNIATYSFTEDATTKESQRITLNDSAGAELGTSGNPVRTNPTGTTTQPVSVGAALPAGSNVVGKVGIDQTTPGTTNGVQVNAALPAGANVIGAVKTDQTTHGVTDQVASDVTKVAGNTVNTGNGTVSSGTQRVALASDNTPFNVSASSETSQVFSGTTALTPKFAVITASSSGATTIVSAVSSKKLRVLALNLIANAAVNVKWQSHVTPTDKTGLAYLGANGGYILPFNPVGWFETVSGEALDINLSGAVAVGGHLTYIEV